MHWTLAVTALAGGLCATAGCSMAMRQVPVTASHVQWNALAGEWRGTYRMDGYDRHGTIAFKLVAIEEQASGEVLMIPERTGWPYTMNRPAPREPPVRVEPRTELLTIRFVEAADGALNGTMDPVLGSRPPVHGARVVHRHRGGKLSKRPRDLGLRERRGRAAWRVAGAPERRGSAREMNPGGHRAGHPIRHQDHRAASLR